MGVAGVLAPKFFKVNGANRAIVAKNLVNLLIVVGHDVYLIRSTTERLGSVNERADLAKFKF